MQLPKNPLRALQASGVQEHPDVLLAAFVAGLVGMLIIPLPAGLLDVFLAANIAVGALLLVVTLLAPTTLSVSTFPTLLLITTLFRLGLNVSTTRMILTKGHAGEVVRAFGEFVVQGDLVVGLVIFLVITLVQYLVIGKGAERVAEVAARFSLDAMPGKQMSIDAAVRSGAISEQEGQDRRDELSRESQLFGAMDGAMKFVKGDAIAGLVITALNLGAGFAIGVMRRGLTLTEAAEVYSILTVGDALVAQIPALLITLAAGVLTTRVRPRAQGHNLGDSLKLELLASPKVLAIGGGLALAIGLVPGMPLIPFLAIGGGLCGLSRAVRGQRKGQDRLAAGDREGRQEAFKKKLEEKVRQAKAQRGLADQMAPTVLPLVIDIDPVLSDALGLEAGSDAEKELLEAIPVLRDNLFLETGVRVPAIKIRSRVPHATPSSFTIRVKEIPVEEQAIPADQVLVLEAASRLTRLGLQGHAASNPLNGTEAAWVAAEELTVVRAAGVSAWTPGGVIVLHLAKVLRGHAKDFLGLQEVSELVDRLEKAYPALVKEVVPKLISLTQLTDILRRLVDERVSVRDLKTILEALAERAAYENDTLTLAEEVRVALSHQIVHACVGRQQSMRVVVLDPLIEESVLSAVRHVRGGHQLALEPELQAAIRKSILKTLRPVIQAGVAPILVTDPAVRRYIRLLVQSDLPEAVVLSYSELPEQLSLHPMGRVVITELAAA